MNGPSPFKSHQGLSTKEAKRRYLELGPNELTPRHSDFKLQDLKRLLMDPMGLMLLALGSLNLLLGNRADGWILFAAYVPILAVDALLEVRAGSALRSLRSTLQQTAKVIRDGVITEVKSLEIVPGDVIVFEEGQNFPADGYVLESDHLAVNESALTGESLPVEKPPGSPFFGGTGVLQGRGLGFIERTGRETRFGMLASLTEETQTGESPLQKRIRRLVHQVLWVAAFLALLLFGVELYRTGNFLRSLMASLTFGMAAVPEEFPLVFTLYLSLGAWRLSGHGVLVKSLPRVETLGSVEVICTDKTGTLTEGKFQVEEFLPPPDSIVGKSGLVALFACEKDPVDSMESAIHEKFKSDLSGLQGWELISDRPFDSTRNTMAHFWREVSSGQTLLALKGAPEGILAGCSLLPGQREKIQEQIEKLARQGKRLLGLASKSAAAGEAGANEESGLAFLGLLVFSDPVRPSAKKAVAECESAGIEIKMLTGDHPLTAHAVADELGIRHTPTGLHTGQELERMDPKSRNHAYLTGSIFSRVNPEQKHELVKSLKVAGKIVAMTGDGINDAPALKLADIGISMGRSATDTARNAAQMVLMENDFGGIVEAVLEGRKIFSNLKRSFSYLIFFHVPVILLALIPPFFAWGDLLLPIHILLLELVVHPVSAFTFENLPLSGTPKKERTLLDSRDATRHALAGLLLSGLALAGFRLAPDVDSGRSAALTTLLAGNIAYVLISTRGARSRRPLTTAFTLGGLLLIGALLGPVSTFLHLGPMGLPQWVVSILTGFLAGISARMKS